MSYKVPQRSQGLRTMQMRLLIVLCRTPEQNLNKVQYSTSPLINAGLVSLCAIRSISKVVGKDVRTIVKCIANRDMIPEQNSQKWKDFPTAAPCLPALFSNSQSVISTTHMQTSTAPQS